MLRWHRLLLHSRNAQKAYDDLFDDRDELNHLLCNKETVDEKEKTPFGLF